MSAPKKEKSIRTISIKSGSMLCEACNGYTISVWTRTRLYKSGKEIERQKCSSCGFVQETEYFKGATTKIRNKK